MADPLVKVPVVLAEPTVSINVDETFTLPIPAGLPGALQIKTIEKRVKLTQCLLALPSNILFIKGFVRKDIQYAVVEGVGTPEMPAVVSNMRDYTIDIPISTQVDLTGTFLTPPIATSVNTRTDFEFLTSTKLPNGFPAKDRLLAGDLTQFDQTSTEYFNELPFCELVSASIIEYDEYLNRTSPIPLDNTPFEEGVFTQVEEKMVVTITLKVLQKQQVTIL